MFDPFLIFIGFLMALAVLLLVLRHMLLRQPRKQILAMVQAQGGAIDLLEASAAASKIRWGTEALDGLVRDGSLCEGWYLMPEPPRPPPPPGHRNIPSGPSWAVYLPGVNKLRECK